VWPVDPSLGLGLVLVIVTLIVIGLGLWLGFVFGRSSLKTGPAWMGKQGLTKHHVNCIDL